MLKCSYNASGNVAARAVSEPLAPQIMSQPVNQIAAPGDIVTFSVVVAEERAGTFQWRFNGVDVSVANEDNTQSR